MPDSSEFTISSKSKGSIRNTRVEAMRCLFAEYTQSGGSVKSFCQSHNLSLHQYHYWRRKFKLNFRRKKFSGRFMKVNLSSSGISGSFYELLFPDGMRFRIPLNFEESSFNRLFRILRGQS